MYPGLHAHFCVATLHAPWSEQLLRGQRFSYDPGGRRDPFESLMEKVKLVEGQRPKGIAGMLVAEVDLVGTIKDRSGGDIAFFMG